MGRTILKRIIKEYYDNIWMQGLLDKQVLRIYAIEKKAIGYELCYRNNYNSKIYARARMNALQMEEHKGRGIQGYDARCKLCQEEDEDIVHFIINCKKLEQKRNYKIIDRNIRDPEERMRVLLFRNKEYSRVRKMIRSM